MELTDIRNFELKRKPKNEECRGELRVEGRGENMACPQQVFVTPPSFKSVSSADSIHFSFEIVFLCTIPIFFLRALGARVYS